MDKVLLPIVQKQVRPVWRENITTIIIIGSTALGGPWSPQANVASDLYPVHPPANFYKPLSLRLLLPRQSILISVGHVLVNLQDLSTLSYLDNSLLSINTTWPAHLSLLDCIALTVLGSLYSW